MPRSIEIRGLKIGQGGPLTLISGPCVIENESHSLKVAEALKVICQKAGVQLIFKSSYDKANRSSFHSFRGPGIEEGLKILERVRLEMDVPILTDVHTSEEAGIAGSVCDVIQIPALLCRQTDLIVAAAKTPAAVNIKKGQFMAPWDMQNAVEKALASGNDRVILTERGFSFGYNNLICDMRAIPIMQNHHVVVCFDATHAVQLPGGLGHASGGERQYIPTLAKSAIAAGADCLFMETHDQPPLAKSDKDCVLELSTLPQLLDQLKRLYEIVHE